jgi:hypothetical protein
MAGKPQNPRKPAKFRRIRFGIEEPKLATALGDAMAYWPWVEEFMIRVMHDLTHGSFARSEPERERSRITFRAMRSQKLRITVLRRLNALTDTSRDYGDLIDKFERLDKVRNKYAHNLWLAAGRDGTDLRIQYLGESELVFPRPGKANPIKLDDLAVFREDCRRLVDQILKLESEDLEPPSKS